MKGMLGSDRAFSDEYEMDQYQFTVPPRSGILAGISTSSITCL